MEFKDQTPHIYSPGQLGKIEEAGHKRRNIRITYTDSKGDITIRTVEPYEVKDNKLYAYCTVRQGIRAFKLERIQSVEITEQTFEPRFPVKLAGE